MKISVKILLIIAFTFTASNTVFGCKPSIKTYIKQIIEGNKSKLDTISQLIVVYNYSPTDTNAVLVSLEKTKKNKWKIKYKPVDVKIGVNGFANPDAKQEGDGKSPSGLFRLGQLFCYQSDVKTHLPYIQTTKEDKWIDDPESVDYNKYIRGETNAKSYEKMLLRSDAYKYCMVIEYNMHPVVKGKGSAIFFHLGKIATSGCVVTDEKNIIKILEWLSPQKNPCILMGSKETIKQGL